MPIILVISKTGNIKEHALAIINDDELYKKAGLKTKDGFACRAKLNVGEDRVIQLYGKITGRLIQENKYAFPKLLVVPKFFGSIVAVMYQCNAPIDMLVPEWINVCGDNCDNDNVADSELPSLVTFNGFDVDINLNTEKSKYDECATEYDNYEANSDDESETDVAVGVFVKCAPKKRNGDKRRIQTTIATDQYLYLDCASELCEEPYATEKTRIFTSS